MSFTNQYNRSSDDKALIKTILYFLFSVVIIVASLITLLINNKNLDKNINKCILNNTQLISTSNDLILEIGSAQRRLLALAVVTDTNKQKTIFEKWELSVNESKIHHDKLIKHFTTDNTTIKPANIIKKAKKYRNEYLKSAEKFIDLLNEGKKNTKISHYLINDLGPNFKKYRMYQVSVSSLLNKQFLAESHEITKKSSATVWIVFSVALFPFFFLGYRLFKK